VKPKKNYDVPDVIGNSYVYQIGDYQVLIMVWSSGRVATSVRRTVGGFPLDATWSAPIEPIRVEKF